MKKNKDVLIISIIVGIVCLGLIGIIVLGFIKNNINSRINNSKNNKSGVIVNYNYDKYLKKISTNKIVMSVFGKSTCSACVSYYPVYESLSQEYNFNVYYYEFNSLTDEEKEELLDIDLTIPSKCSKEAEDSKLSDGFYTPLTLFIKDGQTIDCLVGYNDTETLKNKLNELGIIK